jgi:hypothetical protein
MFTISRRRRQPSATGVETVIPNRFGIESVVAGANMVWTATTA